MSTILVAVAVATGVPPERARDWVRARYHPDALETETQHALVRTRVAADDHIQKGADKTRRALVKTITDELQTEMRSALHADDPLPSLAWAVPSVLAITQRPCEPTPTTN